MKRNKYLIFIALIVSSFLFIYNAKADYKATVLNPSGANCSLRPGSTGYCIYKDESLEEYLPVIVWLDTGDEVNVITDIPTVPTKDANLCSDYYVAVDYHYSDTGYTYRGYYCNANLTTGLLTDELKREFTDLGFPESYFEKLAILKQAHPNWKFRSIDTKLDFKTAINSLNIAGWSLVQKSASNNYAYMDIDSTSFDYKNNDYIPYDSKDSDNAWYNANKETIAYYLDPRNFLIDMYIFQFEGLSFDNSISDENLNKTITEVFKNDYLSKFTNDFVEAGKISLVSPVYLASLAKQEVGGSTAPTSAISGNVSGYEGYYNFYNIGAYSSGNPVINGLIFAKGYEELVQRPWNTEYKAIVGGALWIKENYIGAGQDTSYFKKWNVIHDYLVDKGEIENPFSNYTHQYMTNIMAPASEARTTYKSYYSTGILDSEFTFYIPVFNNMYDTSLPTQGGWPNNYLKSLTINGKDVAGFDGDVTEYNYYLDSSNSLEITANTVSSRASVSGTGKFNIDKDTTNIIKVTAQNGNVREYKINIILTGEVIDTPTDILTTLNNAGIKNSNEYLSGFNVGTDISYIKEKVANANSNATVLLKDSSGNEKNSGKLATGDKVSVTVGNETKEYEVVVYGDVSGDGEINALDFIRIKKYMLNQITLNNSNFQAADISKDGNIDALDFIRIKKYMLGNSSSIQQ